MSKDTKSSKPAKPYDDFPLFPHATKRWAKKIRGKMHYFGPWDDPDGALAKLAESKPHTLYFQYDKEADILILQFVPREVKTVVHYVDDHVALLYQAQDLEIVGLQVEAFERSFLPNHEEVRRLW